MAGTGVWGYSGDGGPATEADLGQTERVTLDTDGTLYLSDEHRIRRVGKDGIITTVAGTANMGGDGGPATEADLYFPSGIALDSDGSLYIADYENNRIRRVGKDGIISTVAGTGTAGYSGDGSPATEAELFNPADIAVSADGTLYIADTANDCIRRVGKDGIITTVAGIGTHGFSGDGGPATAARLYNPRGIAVDTDGTLYIADFDNHRIRRVGKDGIITTVAGTGSRPSYGYSGDGGPATGAGLVPTAIAVGADGALYIADFESYNIRRVMKSHLPDFSLEDVFIASKDSTEFYIFDPSGRHLRTLDAITGAPIYTFTYDNNGLLTSITDADGDITTIERNAGVLTAIVSPDNQRTIIGLDDNGYLDTLTNPANETHKMVYTPDGLMEEPA